MLRSHHLTLRHRILSVFMALAFVLNSGRTQTRIAIPKPVGRLVDVGGYRVHLYCVGTGTPTVVITGAGYSFDWGLVQPEVAKFARVCAYDHSGVAWSDPGPTDTCSLRVGELHAALKNANMDGPYLLVGHSLGALVSRLYASKYPDEIVGMVIVDHAGAFTYLPWTRPTLFESKVGERYGFQSAVPIAPVNPPVDVPSESADMDADFKKLPADDYKLHLWANSLPGHSAIMTRNEAIMAECTSDLQVATRNQTHPLESKPLIVLSTPAGQSYASQLASLSSNGKQLVVFDSSHFIMVDRPDVVISAIREAVEAARSGRKLNK
jgi:pimeloyl-ACP methyl ester carboxylesterase